MNDNLSREKRVSATAELEGRRRAGVGRRFVTHAGTVG